jgi:arginine exporter protein ArgO
MNNSEQNENHNTREDFCAACVTAPLAFLGAGVAGAGANKKGSHKRTKQILLWGGIVFTLLSLAVALYFWRKCDTCR